MTTVLVVVHVILAVLLVAAVLLQRGLGAEIGVSFGGGSSQTLFGARGATPFLAKVTWVLAVGFMLTSLSLAFFAHREAGSVATRTLAPTAPAKQNPAPAKPKVPQLPPAE